ncbi:hypothetical protein QBC44DRAFT_234235 [Cladorrhinum sp. PSN332]|nr:hypothetical protein QBC44DRAFT_234235 [Cladorrhinum sp. PSN332]
MEALEVISLASNILQFIELGSKIVKGSREIYQSANGTTKELEDLEETCRTISRLSAGLVSSHSPQELSSSAILKKNRPLPAEIDLVRVALRCKEASDKLYQELEALRLNGSSSRGKAAAFRQSIKNLWARSNLKDLENTMESCRKDLMMCLTVVTAYSSQGKRGWQSALMKHFAGLQSANFNIIPEHSEKLDQLLEDIVDVNTQARLCLDSASSEEMMPLIHSLSRILEDSADADRHRWEAEHTIVKALGFEDMHARRESIPESHASTFQWILRQGHPRSRFLEWLQTGEGIYWISGKPGSGKSTLMKFLGDSPEVQTALQHWAGDKKCVFVSCYFWLAGSPLQKSLEGLLKTLLFDIFVQNPRLIPLAVPDRWEDLMKTGSKPVRTSSTAGDKAPNFRDWTVSEMLSVLRNLSVVEDIDARFCLFIDGLDEYNGDHRDLVQNIKAMSIGPNFKLCVSSRPWIVFEDTLGLDTTKKLYIHELTGGDIRRYAEDKFNENIQWKRKASTDVRYSKLIEDIIDKAKGVFLWVVLVVQSLGEGISNGDSVYLLEKRLHELPSELEPFFRHILDSVPHRYHKHMALYFQVTLEALKPVSLLHYSFLDEYLESDDNFILLDGHVDVLGDPDLHARHTVMQRRLNARCKGLLLADGRDPDGHLLHDSEYDRYREYSYWPDSWTAGFLHRTVHDFLRTEEMQRFLEEVLGGCKANEALMMAHILFAKVADLNPAPEELLGQAHLEQALHYSAKARNESCDSDLAVACTDELIRTHSEYVDDRTIVDMTLRNNLCEYVKMKLDAGSHGYRNPTELLANTLRAVLRPMTLADWANILPMVELLLGSGAKPSTSILELYLADLGTKVSSCRDQDFLKHHQDVLSLLLSAVNDINHIAGGKEGGGVVWGPFFLNVTFVNWSDSLVPRKVADAWVDLAQVLFTRGGADPNAPFRGTTSIWTEIQDTLSIFVGTWMRERKPAGLEVTARFIEMMVRAGADVNSPGSLSTSDIREIFPFRAANRILYAISNQQSAAA